MKSNVILQKKDRDADFGYLFILYSNGNKRQKKSLNRRMTEDEFEYYNKEFKAFSKNKKFDVTDLNNQISKLINIDVFKLQSENKIEVEVEVKTSYLNYYKIIMEKVEKPSTKKSYINSYNKLNQYLLSLNKTDLLFSELNKEFIKPYLTYLRNKSLTDSTIKTYLSSMKAVMNDAIDNDKYYYTKNPFRKLELKIDVKPKRLVTREDISKLRHITKEDELFIYSRMFLLSLYTQGMRVSDLVLLKVSNFTKDHCEYMMLKNKKTMKIDIDRNINKMLIDILQLPDYYTQYKETKIISIYGNQSYSYTELFGIIRKRYANLPDESNSINYKNFDYVDKNDKELQSNIDRLDDISNQIDVFVKRKINDDLKKLPKDQYLFQSVIKSDVFKSYNKLNTFTTEQYNKMKSINAFYYTSLKKICKKFELSVDKLSSHNARHTFVNRIISLDGINLQDIRSTLGHAELSTTSGYISVGFEFKKGKIISDDFNKDHRL